MLILLLFILLNAFVWRRVNLTQSDISRLRDMRWYHVPYNPLLSLPSHALYLSHCPSRCCHRLVDWR